MELLNSTIGKYQLIKFIGEGGMASVYEGKHIYLGTKAAVKVLNPILAKNHQFRQRFQNEAAFMATLDHPNITKVLDFENTDERLAIIMELLDGKDLNELVIEKGAMSFDAFKPILVQILDAFKYAHEKGIIHRDIKPSNIFILSNGQVKILDFGIAKLFGQGNEMTQTGAQMGTPIYMSPEQVRADKSIDHRSDIYSLGVTLFFAIEGRAPYDSQTESQFDIFNKIVFEPLPHIASKGKVGRIIAKACEKDRENRFQSCIDFQKSLETKPIEKSEKKEDRATTSVKDGSEKTTTFVPVQNDIENEKTSKLATIVFLMSIFNILFFVFTREMVIPKIISLVLSLVIIKLSLNAMKYSKNKAIKNTWMSSFGLYSSLFIVTIIFLVIVFVYTYS